MGQVLVMCTVSAACTLYNSYTIIIIIIVMIIIIKKPNFLMLHYMPSTVWLGFTGVSLLSVSNVNRIIISFTQLQISQAIFRKVSCINIILIIMTHNNLFTKSLILVIC